MTLEGENWIKRVSGGTNPEEEVQTLLDSGKNLAAEYGAAQEAAREYIERGEEIPENLIAAINKLSGERSGFTGLTTYEAFVHSLRQNRNQP